MQLSHLDQSQGDDISDRQRRCFSRIKHEKQYKKKDNNGKMLRPLLGCAFSLLLTCPSILATEVEETPQPVGELLFSQDTFRGSEGEILSLHRYSPEEETKNLTFQDPWALETQINYISPDAVLQFQSYQDDVWVYVQYLTDIDGDGNYEWLLQENNIPYWDILSKGNTLSSTKQISSWNKMSVGQLRTITAANLFQYGLNVEEVRRETVELEHLNSGNTIFHFLISELPLHEEKTLEETWSEDSVHSYYVKIDNIGHEDTTLFGAYHLEDVSFSGGYFQAVDFCVTTELLPPISNSEFALEKNMTRGDIVEAMYRYHGSPETYPRTFGDISSEDWFATSFTWAVSRGFVGAIGGCLRPEENVTREEFVSILYNYANSLNRISNPSLKTNSYRDGKEITSKYATAVLWGLENEFLFSTDGYIYPQETITRGEAAILLMQFVEHITTES